MSIESHPLQKRLLSTTAISEPDPTMFGNDPNPRTPPATWSPDSKNWLRSRFHFSFAEWGRGPMGFGVLRVLNDDLVQPHRMFGPHPHRDMEIATYVVKGELTHWHEDRSSRGGSSARESLGRGSVQFMTAGTGVTHSEGNDSDSPLRFIQMWIVPRKRGLRPNYASCRGDAKQRDGQWQHLVGDVEDAASGAAVRINQDCNIFVTELHKDADEVALRIQPGRQAYVVNLEGQSSWAAGGDNGASLPTVTLDTYESGTVSGPAELLVRRGSASGAAAATHILVVEMAASASTQ
eukprot:CAMPEP_0176409532 /NCGR_PEP_ID=MMETSP0127-20121128/2550_1 /TAXON_ID=938130 /ORGANISM="Platyophrya macrostoma, Strain WH" /LENGTH=292 /DNA_ID=CAMNT_0017788921 /DNA_START=81 /DNA_END=959 /DNA_ORIENTATION=+